MCHTPEDYLYYLHGCVLLMWCSGGLGGGGGGGGGREASAPLKIGSAPLWSLVKAGNNNLLHQSLSRYFLKEPFNDKAVFPCDLLLLTVEFSESLLAL